MKKIVFLPLDERPCNAKFPIQLFHGDTMQIVSPSRLGNKKSPADTKALGDFLRRECADADGLVVSMDMLLYGGLVPSRLHGIPQSELIQGQNILRQIKRENSNLRIFAFHCVMRCPTYSNSQEEPDYYGDFGAEIHALGVARHKALDGDEKAQRRAQELEERIPAKALEDYLSRREQNLFMNMEMLQLVKDGTVEFLAIPQDDSAPFGFTALDQRKIREEIRRQQIQNRVVIYPGADELGMTLLARMQNALENRCPAVYPLYASAGAPFVIPTYEDRPLAETVHYQIMVSGCRLSASPEQADFILALTAPAANMAGAACQPRFDFDYDVGRSLTPFFAQISYWMDADKPVSICDNAYGNGGDLELLFMLNQSNRMMKVAGYAGWNTSSNTMGTALAQGVRYLYRGCDKTHLDFLALRYVEDCAYDSVVRQTVTRQDLPSLGLDYFEVDGPEGKAAQCVEKRLQDYVHENMESVADKIQIHHVRLPWSRMFEAELDVEYNP